MATFQAPTQGLFSWIDNPKDPFLLCRGSMFAENEFDGLEIMRFEPLNHSSPFPLVGRFETGISFNCLTWHDIYPDYSKGIITGGLKDGSLVLIDAGKIIQNATEEKPHDEDIVVSSFELYQNGDFYCLEYNPSKPTLLATGGQDIFIVNFDKGFTEPDIFCPTSKSVTSNSIITSIAWNKTKAVQHILASAQDNGVINIVDLKLKKSILSFSDGKENVNKREIGISWNPSIPTQIAVAFDHHDSGVQLWDLRNSKSPVKILDPNFFKNVNSINWSPVNKNAILLADKNGNFTQYFTDTDKYSTYHQDDFRTLYAKYTPIDNLYYGVSFEGRLIVHSTTETELNQLAMKNMSSWLKPKSFATGSSNGTGILVSVSNDLKKDVCSFKVTHGARDKTAADKAVDNFVDNFNHNRTDVNQFAARLIKNKAHDRYLIELIQNIDKSCEEKLKYLDIDADGIIKNTEKLTGFSYTSKAKDNHVRPTSSKQAAPITEDEALDFFSDLGKQQEEEVDKSVRSEFKRNHEFFEEASMNELKHISYELNTNWNKGFESYIKKNILINNYEGAIDCAVKANRIFEAFMIAYSHNTQRDYFVEYLVDKFSSEDDFLKSFIKPLTTNDFASIINSYDVNEWKDILTFIIKNVKDQNEREHHYRTLAERIKASGMDKKIVNYILLLSNKVSEFVSNLEEELRGNSSVTALVNAFEILYLLKLKLNFTVDHNILEEKLIKIVRVLLEADSIHLAYELLSLFGNKKEEETLILQNMLYSVHSDTLKQFYHPPLEIKKVDFHFPKPKRKEPLQEKAGVKKGNPFLDRKPQNAPTSQTNIFDDNKLVKTIPPPPSKIVPKPPDVVKPSMLPPNLPPQPQHSDQQSSSNQFSGTSTSLNKPPKPSLVNVPKPPAFVHPPLPQQIQKPNDNVDQPPKSLNLPHGVSGNQESIQKPPAPQKLNPGPPPIKPINPPMPHPQPTTPNSELKNTAPSKQTFNNMAPPPPPVPKPAEQPKTLAPPPPSLMKPPVPPPHAPLKPPQPLNVNYDPKKVSNLLEFIDKTPMFISSIETNPAKAKQMEDSLSFMVNSIKNKAFDLQVFEQLYQIVNYIEEDKVKEASFVLNKLLSQSSGELTATLQTFKRFIAALS